MSEEKDLVTLIRERWFKKPEPEPKPSIEEKPQTMPKEEPTPKPEVKPTTRPNIPKRVRGEKQSA